MKPELDYLRYARRDMSIDLVANYIFALKSREPPYKESLKTEYVVWSSAKVAAETILEQILDGVDPIIAAEDYAVQMDYFSEKASVAGNYEASTMFTTGSDVAIDLLQIFHDNDIHYEEDIYNE